MSPCPGHMPSGAFGRSCVTALLLPLAGCLADAPRAEPPSGASCGADRLGGLIGQPESALAGVTVGGPLRVIHPGEAVTMDFNAARLTVGIDDRGRIATLSCG